MQPLFTDDKRESFAISVATSGDHTFQYSEKQLNDTRLTRTISIAALAPEAMHRFHLKSRHRQQGSEIMYAHKIRRTSDDELQAAPKLKVLDQGDSDFISEAHAGRKALIMPSLFREVMSKKTANTADARQKRGK